MPNQNDNSYKLLWMLGLALTLPMVLLAGPVAGFAIGYWLQKQYHTPGFVTPLAMGIGLLGSAMQAYRLISKISHSKKEK